MGEAWDDYFVPLLETVHINCLGTSLKLVDNMSMYTILYSYYSPLVSNH